VKIAAFAQISLLCATAALLSAAPAWAQAPAGTVHGMVVDAEGARPLQDASVSLAARAPTPPPRTTRTDAEGRYRFDGVADGVYLLRVRRLGYRADSLEVVLRAGGAPQVSVGLAVAPLVLEPLTATAGRGASTNPFGERGGGTPVGGARVAVERERQRSHLAPDVRAVTAAEVEEGVTLAEADLLRALQRLPGVSARDDYSAEVWTRGAPWDHTRVYWDGMPLYNPVHSMGVFSGVNTDAVGSALFHPGAQPVSTPGGAAATLELRSRGGGTRERAAASAELSLASLRAAADGVAGPLSWMLAARRSYSRWLLSAVEDRARPQDVWATDRFDDVASRVELRLGGSSIEASLLRQRDVVREGPDTDWVGGTPPRWESLAARATLRSRLAGVPAELTAGTSLFGADVRSSAADTIPAGVFFSWPTLYSARSRVRYTVLEGRMGPPGQMAPWSAGAAITRHAVGYDGPPTFPRNLRLPPDPVSREGALAYASFWSEARWVPGPRLAVEGGVRLDAGSRVAGGDALRWAPRVAARFQAMPRASISAAARRSWQYVQSGPELGAHALTQHSWLVAGAGIPALRSDVFTLGGEAWAGRAWLASVALYERRSAGVAAIDPRPGEVVGRPDFVAATMEAEGVELSVRRLEGRWTASAAYAWGASTTRAAGLKYASGADLRHSLDLSARAALGRGFHAGGALSASTGGAFNRFFAGIATCGNQLSCEWAELPRAGAPGAVRSPPYASLDLALDWTRAFGPVRVTAYGRVSNVLGRENPARYNHSVPYPRCGYGRPVEGEPGCTDDVWSRGLPRLPVAGMRVTL
jgi:hypothetical protein